MAQHSCPKVRSGRDVHLNAKPPTQWLSAVADHWHPR
jgi:hypothetical protein